MKMTQSQKKPDLFLLLYLGFLLVRFKEVFSRGQLFVNLCEIKTTLLVLSKFIIPSKFLLYALKLIHGKKIENYVQHNFTWFEIFF